jgi:hypothetical protein
VGPNNPARVKTKLQTAGDSYPHIADRLFSYESNRDQITSCEAKSYFGMFQFTHCGDLILKDRQIVFGRVNLDLYLFLGIRLRHLLRNVGFKDVPYVPVEEGAQYFPHREQAEDEGAPPTDKLTKSAQVPEKS